MILLSRQRQGLRVCCWVTRSVGQSKWNKCPVDSGVCLSYLLVEFACGFNELLSS